MDEKDLTEARKRALLEVKAYIEYDPLNPKTPPPSPEFIWRHIFREYIKRFHISLIEAKRLPQEKIFEQYYQALYDDMVNAIDPKEEERLRKELGRISLVSPGKRLS